MQQEWYGGTEGYEATVGGEASSILNDEWNGSVLGGLENNLCAPLQNFGLENIVNLKRDQKCDSPTRAIALVQTGLLNAH